MATDEECVGYARECVQLAGLAGRPASWPCSSGAGALLPPASGRRAPAGPQQQGATITSRLAHLPASQAWLTMKGRAAWPSSPLSVPP
jgi:hypothetical protein